MSVDQILNSLSLEQKVGQMFMLNIDGKAIDSQQLQLIKRFHLGNLILFTKNLGTHKEVQELTAKFQEYSKSEFGLPAFISTDMEGGNVIRFGSDFPMFPGAAAVSSTGSLDKCELLSENVAKFLLNLGINMNLAPVCDVNDVATNPVIGARSFGNNPEIVSKFIKSHIKGHKKTGCLTCAKHFPGHGSTTQDSHEALPHITHTYDEFLKKDIPPFIEAISEGVDAIMTAHLLTPIDPDNPASLSPKVINYLRNELNYQGLIVTDSLVMKGVSMQGVDVAVRKAILAGNDILIANANDIMTILVLIQKAVDDVKNGLIDEKLINDACRRIINAKLKLNDKKKDEYNRDEFISISHDISKKSIAIFRDDNKLIPLKSKKILCISSLVWNTISSFENIATASFGQKFKQLINQPVEDVEISQNPTQEEIDKALDLAKSAEVVVFSPLRIIIYKGQHELLRKLLEVNKNVIYVSLFDPYEVMLLDDVSSIIVGFEYNDLSIQSSIDVLIGTQKASGNFNIN